MKMHYFLLSSTKLILDINATSTDYKSESEILYLSPRGNSITPCLVSECFDEFACTFSEIMMFAMLVLYHFCELFFPLCLRYQELWKERQREREKSALDRQNQRTEKEDHQTAGIMRLTSSLTNTDKTVKTQQRDILDTLSKPQEDNKTAGYCLSA